MRLSLRFCFALLLLCAAITCVSALQPQSFHRALLNKGAVNKTAHEAWDTASDAAHAARNGIKLVAQATETLKKATKQK